MEYEITNGGRNIHIIDSWKVPKKDFDKCLNEIWMHYSDCEVFNRSRRGMKLEWATHNFLYSVGIASRRTKDTDLNYPQSWYVRFSYSVIGALCWVFVK